MFRDRGAVENVNGVIRVEFPRSLNIDAIKQDEISKIADEINERPLKCLGYKTPKEVFMGYTGCI
jgi:IS30 family transposase